MGRKALLKLWKQSKLPERQQILRHYDPQLLLSLACDASSVGVGAVIFHKLPNGTDKVVAYASRKLSLAEKYAQIQREALSIV